MPPSTLAACTVRGVMALVQRLLPAGILALVAALGCGAAGFVYAHEPARDEVALDIDRSPPAAAQTIVSGAITRVADGRLVIEGEGGTTEVALPAGASVEELQTVAPAALVPGVRVNVGAERSDYGVALTGVVVVAGP